MAEKWEDKVIYTMAGAIMVLVMTGVAIMGVVLAMAGDNLPDVPAASLWLIAGAGCLVPFFAAFVFYVMIKRQ